jgi:transcription initiation factor TFIIH subunit 3
MAAQNNPPTLLLLILDLSPPTWGDRSIYRAAKDKALAARGKSSAGPAIIDDVVISSLSFLAAFTCMNRDNVAVVIGVTETDVGVIYPRKGGEGCMDEVVNGGGAERVDRGMMNDYVRLGVAELVNRAAERREKMEKETDTQSANLNCQSSNPIEEGAAIASALSLALCIINRFMVASHAGVSALSDPSTTYQRREDEGVLALMNGGASGGSTQEQPKKGLLTSRALIIQSSPDRTSDYNALMNCAFAAHKQNVVIDGCFIPSDRKEDAASSPFLEQIVHQTSGIGGTGIYLSVPKGPAQVNGALSEVLLSVFLPPTHLRKEMNLPKLTKVDFRARCFETGECIDIGRVCNQCLSIFKERPRERCWTCGAKVRERKKKGSGEDGAKRMKIDS